MIDILAIKMNFIHHPIFDRYNDNLTLLKSDTILLFGKIDKKPRINILAKKILFPNALKFAEI